VAGVEVKIEGIAPMLSKLREYGRDGARALDQGLAATAADARAEAVKSIQRGPKTGRTYPRVRGRRGSPHTASAPGQAPATDTGRLASSIRAARSLAGDHLVGTALEYGRALEFGTSRMQPRPWLLPAVQKAAPRLAKRIEQALVRLRRGG